VHLSLRLILPSEARSVPLVRKVLRHALGILDVAPESVDDVELAMSEACTNVLDHAGGHEEYVVLAGIHEDKCVLEVCDQGGSFDEPPATPEGTLIDPNAETGRGVQLMRALVDRLDFRFCDDRGTVVRLEKTLEYEAQP
jgi:serine/threonine-protein kinase RsbW